MTFFYTSSSNAELNPPPMLFGGTGAGLETHDVGRDQCYGMAARYAHLQGLRILPLGIAFLVSAAWRAGWLPWPPGTAVHMARIAFLAALTLAVVVSFPIRSAYWRRAGRPRVECRRTGAVTLTLVAGVVVLSTGLPSMAHSPSMPAIVVALSLIYPVLSADVRRWHYLPLAAAWCLFALSPLLGMSRPTRAVK